MVTVTYTVYNEAGRKWLHFSTATALSLEHVLASLVFIRAAATTAILE
jgi:hypothetical protein